MNQPRRFIVGASIALAYAAAAIPATAATSVLDASHPFARVSTLPFNYPSFDKIKDEHFKPAFEAGQPLARVSTTFSNLQAANTGN